MASALAPLEPLHGAWFGVNIDNAESMDAFSARVGFQPVSFGIFVQFPLQQLDLNNLRPFLDQVVKRRGIALITLEPTEGLQAVTEAATWQLANLLAPYEAAGASFMVRFAHEMNGSWYVWSQQPRLYIQKFRLVAAILQAVLRQLAMLWAPNNGSGYPFLGGAYSCRDRAQCPDFDILDTNGDGIINMYDDMYTPYYPGDDAVDWVGMTLYWWGAAYPYGRNDAAEPWSFYNRLRGLYKGARGDESMIPDFYGTFCADAVHRKPMAIPETAALFNTQAACCQSEIEVKSSWWNQVFNVEGTRPDGGDVSERLPQIKMINWFEWRKQESELQNAVVDWTFSNNAAVKAAFTSRLMSPSIKNGERYWRLLEDWHAELQQRSPPKQEQQQEQQEEQQEEQQQHSIIVQHPSASAGHSSV